MPFRNMHLYRIYVDYETAQLVAYKYCLKTISIDLIILTTDYLKEYFSCNSKLMYTHHI